MHILLKIFILRITKTPYSKFLTYVFYSKRPPPRKGLTTPPQKLSSESPYVNFNWCVWQSGRAGETVSTGWKGPGPQRCKFQPKSGSLFP